MTTKCEQSPATAGELSKEEIATAEREARYILAPDRMGAVRDESSTRVARLALALLPQAARVPGLVTEVERLKHGWTTATKQATNCARCHVFKHTPWRAHDGYVCAGCLGAEVANLKDERDAAQKERDLAKLRLERDGGRLADEVAVLVRQRVVDQRSPVADALLDFREPPASERADRLVVLEKENTTLRERVATLEADRAIDSVLADEHSWRLTEAGLHQLSLAEARVKELEANVERQWKERQALEHAAETRVRELEWSQPPPAQAQGVDTCGACGKPLESSRTAVCQTCVPEREWFAQAAAVEAVMSPTPPPGLREAVQRVLDLAASPFNGGDTAWRNALDALRAAYDATGGEHGPVVPDDVRTELAGYLYEAQGLTGHVRELLAPGDRGRLRLTTLRKLADSLNVKPGVSR